MVLLACAVAIERRGGGVTCLSQSAEIFHGATAADDSLALEDGAPMPASQKVAGRLLLGIADHDRSRSNGAWRKIIKLLEDQILGAMLLLTTAPLIVAIAVLIKIDSRGPVFFIQRRFGYKNSVINVIKFRSMYVDRGDPSGAQRPIRNDPRVTRVGRLLRLFSLDELPQLINVIRGDMSLIGPRPHAVAMKIGDRVYGEAVKHYDLRHAVKPGITGWAQVNALRDEVDTLDKARARVTYDLHYIEHWSAWLDFKILLKTATLFFNEQAY